MSYAISALHSPVKGERSWPRALDSCPPSLRASAFLPSGPIAPCPGQAPRRTQIGRAQARTEGRPNPTVSLVGLQVSAKSRGKARCGDTIAFGGQTAVSLALAVKVAPGTGILDIDDEESTVETWTFTLAAGVGALK